MTVTPSGTADFARSYSPSPQLPSYSCCRMTCAATLTRSRTRSQPLVQARCGPGVSASKLPHNLLARPKGRKESRASTPRRLWGQNRGEYVVFGEDRPPLPAGAPEVYRRWVALLLRNRGLYRQYPGTHQPLVELEEIRLSPFCRNGAWPFFTRLLPFPLSDSHSSTHLMNETCRGRSWIAIKNWTCVESQ